MDLSKARHAFVTGGASGIGLGIADALARRGLSVTIADIDGEAIARMLKSRPQRFRGTVLDVRDRKGWAEAKAAAEAAFGPVDILVNNAGIAPDGKQLADMAPDSFDLILGINLVGVFNGVSAFGSDMRARGQGHIVNTSSIMGFMPGVATIGGYAATKSAVIALSEVLRQEMAPHGVGVSVLCPGVVVTNLRESTAKVGGGLHPNASMSEGGMDAAEAGEITVKGIEADAPYILTHPEDWPGVEVRLTAIRDAFAEAK